MAKQKRKQNTLYTLLGKIGDIILVPIIVLSLFVSTLILFHKRADRVPFVFGHSIVRILTGSMVKLDFMPGDNVFIKKIDTDELNNYDIIAFYSYQDPLDEDVDKYNLLTEKPTNPKPEPEGRVTQDKIYGKGYYVVFHQIIGIYYDESGTRYFETKGASNDDADSDLVRDEFVVGKYIETPTWVRKALSWMSSSLGMIFCVCLPLGLLVIFETLALIEQINFYYVEKKLLNGNMHWQDREAMRLIRTGEMEEVVRVIYLVKVDDDEKEEVKDALYMFDGYLTKKEKRYKEKVEKGWKILDEKGVKEYYIYWKRNLKYKIDGRLIDEELNMMVYNETF